MHEHCLTPPTQHGEPQTEQESFKHSLPGVHTGGKDGGNEGGKDGGNDGAGALGVTAAEAAEVALTP